MLEFTDKPYQFFPPKPNGLMIRLAHWYNQHFSLPGKKHRISELEIGGGEERVSELVARGCKVLFLPNHSTHSDPQIMSEVHRRLGLPSPFMAAYDVFLRARLDAWVMQHTGSFSVDREGSDRKAMTTAIDVLKEIGSLTIFPEGNVYFTSDSVTPFLEGAAFVGVRAQKSLGDDGRVYAVPVAIKVSHLVDQRDAVLKRLDQVAQMLGSECDRDADEPLLELRRIGALALEKHLADLGMDSPDHSLPIDDRLKQMAGELIGGLEEELGLKAKADDTMMDRLRKVRAKIHQARMDNEDDDAEVEARETRWANQAILALRMLGYTGNYVAANPTLDRFAETAEKLLEDMISASPRPYGKRRAIVHLCEPIDLREFTARGGIEKLTDQVEAAVQDEIDRINAANECAGGEMF